MTPLDDIRLDIEFHGHALERALGSGGAPIDLERARVELLAVEAALAALALHLNAEAAP